MFKEGFVVISFLVMLTICLSIHGFLCEKIMLEMDMMEDLVEINWQIQHERNLIEQVLCLIQCETVDEMFILVDGQHVEVHFYDGFCVVSDPMVTLTIQYDADEKVLINVTVEK